MLLPILLATTLVAAQDTTRIVLVATTDVHGRLPAWNYITDSAFAGGLERAGTVLDSLRRRYPTQLVLVDAGDLIQGSPFATYFAREDVRDPHPILDAMGALGYDAATPGNHEFNFGVPFMVRALRGARFPYVSANIHRLPDDSLLFPAYTILHRNGVRVGITGVTTPGVMVWDGELVRGQARVAPIPEAAERVLAILDREADLRIVLAHSGLDGAASYDTTGVGGEDVMARLAGSRYRPHVVVVGHTHREMADSVINGVHFVQPRHWAQSLSVTHIDLVRGADGWRVVRIRGEIIPLAGVPPQAALTRRLAPQHQAVREWAARPLGRAWGPMRATTARAEATAIVHYVNEVQRRRAGAELSATAVFDHRAGFAEGDIRMADVAALYPYENTLRAVRVTGAQLRAFLEHSARYWTVDSSGRVRPDERVPGYNFDIVSGAEYVIDLRYPVGSRIRELRVRGREVQPADAFTLAVNSYRQAGGGGYAMLAAAPVVYDRGENIRDLLVEDIRTRGYVNPEEYRARTWRIVPADAEFAAIRVFAPDAPRPPQPTPPRDTTVLRVFSINDLHGALLPRVQTWSGGAPVGGVAALKGLMDSLARDCGCPDLRLDAGDQMQGTIPSNAVHGRSTVAALNRIGIAAAAIGNHDFDWSVDTLLRRMSEARYAWLSANVFDSATGRRPDWAIPYRILPAGRFRVGVIGYTTPITKSIVRTANLAGLRFGGPEVLPALIREVRGQGADLVILTAHEGAACGNDLAVCEGEILDLARSLDSAALDLIVAGHRHNLMSTRVNGIPIMSAGSSGRAVGVADVVKTLVGGLEVRTRVDTVWTGRIRPDPVLAVLEADLARASDSLMNRPVATLAMPMARQGVEYPLGNLIADGVRNATRAEIGLINNGGIRADLQAGTLTFGKAFEVNPFQNELVRMRLSGRQLLRLLEQAVQDGTPGLHLSGLRVTWDAGRPAGQRVREARLTTGRRVEERGSYTVGLNEFLAEGKDGYTVLEGVPVERTGVLDLDGLLAYLQRLPQPVRPPEGERWVQVGRQ